MKIRFAKAKSPSLRYSDSESPAQVASTNPQSAAPSVGRNRKALVKKIAFGLGAITLVGLIAATSFLLFTNTQKPERVHVTNITSSSASIVWRTKSPSVGMVVVQEGESRLPFKITTKNRAVDDRDYSSAELEAAARAAAQRDGSSISSAEIEYDVEVTDFGKFHTHHVTVKNLDPDKKYSFKIGSNYLFKGSKENVFSTKALPETPPTPEPAYGTVYDYVEGKNEYDLSQDSVVIISYEADGNKQYVSSPVNPDNSSWYADLSPVSLQYDGSLETGISSKYEFEIAAFNDKSTSLAEKLFFDRKAPYPNILIEGIEEVMFEDDGAQSSGSLFVSEVLADKHMPNPAGCDGTLCNWCATFAEKLACDTSGKSDASNKTAPTPPPSPNVTSEPPNNQPLLDPNRPNDCTGKENSCGAGSCWTGPDPYDGGYACDCNDNTRVWNRACPPPPAALPLGESAPVVPTSCSEVACGFGGACDPHHGGPNDYKCICKGADVVNGTCAAPAVEEGDAEDDAPPGNVNVCCKLSSGAPPTWMSIQSCPGANKVDDNMCQGSPNDYVANPPPQAPPTPVRPRVCCHSPGSSDGYIAKEESLCAANGQVVYAQVNEQGTCPAVPVSNGNLELTQPVQPIEEDPTLWKTYGACEQGCPDQPGYNCYKVPYNFFGTRYQCQFNQGALDYENGVTPPPEQDPAAGLEPCSPELYCLTGVEGGNACISTRGSVTHCCPIEQTLGGSKCVDKKANNKANIRNDLRSLLVSRASAQEVEQVLFDPVRGNYAFKEAGRYILDYNGKQYEVEVIAGQDAGVVYKLFIDENGNGELDDGETVIAQDPIAMNLKKDGIILQYNIKAGFNFVTFPFVMSDNTAKKLLRKIAADNGQDSVYSIAEFQSTWKVVGNNGGEYDVNDFQIVPGKGYLIKARKDFVLNASGKEVLYESEGDRAPLRFAPGWNLMGLYGTGTQSYTASSLLDDINAYEDPAFLANNLTRWPSDKQRYEGLQKEVDENGTAQVYGFDYPLTFKDAYFLRVVEGDGIWEPTMK